MKDYLEIKVSENDVQNLGFNKACFLAYVRSVCKPNVFTQLTVSFVKEETGILDSTQFRYFKQLEEEGYLEINHQTIPKTRYIKIIK